MIFSDELKKILPELRAFARSLARDTVHADDLVQETCLRAWYAREQFDTSRPFRPWVFRILRNAFYERSRRMARRVDMENEFFESELVEECRLEERSDLARMTKAIYSLKPKQRDAFILAVVAGFTYEETAEICETSSGTIKSRVSRARETILEVYESSGPVKLPDDTSDFDLDHPMEAFEAHLRALQANTVAA
ncbi:MAG: sigma-70 family RNA polymerase sigma factor [Pseudomonadota bacterium]